MRLSLKPRSPLLPTFTVIACSYFAAKAASHVVAATVLGEREHSVVPTSAAPRAAPAPPRHSKDGRQLVERNMFCSECTPPPAANPTDPSQVPITSLPLSLVATNVAADSARSIASVIDTGSQRMGAYRVGDLLPGAGPIKLVRYQYVDFEHSGRIERLLLGGGAAPAEPVLASAAPAAEAPAAVPTDPDSVQAALEAGIHKLDDTSFEVSRSLVEQALANPMAFIKGGRAVPSMIDGKPSGFRLYGVRAGSTMARLGLVTGDTLTAVNGLELTSMEATMNIYTKLRDASSLELAVTRKGKPTTLRYAIR